MRRLRLLLLSLLALPLTAAADEGMWLPSLVSERIADMQAKGLKLSAEDIYSVNHSSLKDAVMLFGRGCTGELISSQGLLITNHHCGYGQIQQHSSVEHDYLKDGFWAMSMEEELPNPGLSVKFLDFMEDVTDQVLKGVKKNHSEIKRAEIISRNIEKIIRKHKDDKNFKTAQVEALFNGNQYFLYVFTEFKDVRLVGAPPSSVGKFGGDTDNWMWPRHTGDFSIFRIYADKNNRPAEYSEDNVPYKPEKFFPVSTKGVEEGDFTFIYGCPGTTREYITSDAVRYITEISDPLKVGLRTLIIQAQKEYMSKDQAVRIKYSSKNAGVANAWKKWQGEMLGVRKNKIVDKKKAYEAGFRKWAEGTEYEGVLDSLRKMETALEAPSVAMDYYNEAIRAVEVCRFAGVLADRLEKGEPVDQLADAFYKDYHEPIDRTVFKAVIGRMAESGTELSPYMTDQIEKYGTVEKWADALFDGTRLTDRAGFDHIMADTEKAVENLRKDPAYIFSAQNSMFYTAGPGNTVAELKKRIAPLYRKYMKGMMEYEPDRAFYPDANLTLRVAYGKVSGYSPVDGVTYLPVSTLEGIMEKDNPEIFDYNIPQKLREVYAAKDYGRWAVGNTVPVCFIATNHTTGGNSGSPVINAEGELVGVNFDRVWEGTMSDLAFDPEICRNICLDIRYVLFYIDKMAGVPRLIEEMELR